MADKELLFIPVLLLLCQIFYGEATQECTEAEYSKFGMMLRRHIFKKIMGVSLSGLCLVDCYQDVRCQSFNYVISKYMCEFNNRTKEARPEDYVPDPDRLYFRRDMNRVLLGSIPELPAETCREIKLSEGGQAVSDKYWFDSIIPGKTVLAHCDMKKEDLDECSSSIPVCDVNANCKNTRGSYRCSCKAGYTGNGKTCADIDECSASNPVCDVNANCQNTRGSYVCSCKAGFTGDGKTCTDIDECGASNPVCDVNANCQNTPGFYVCSCKPGFTGDGKTCTDIDECSASIRVCDVNANCQNTDGSYSCSCKAGLTGDGKTCADIDECVSGVHDCHSSASCTNTVGSYSCSCNHPYTGDGKTCTHTVTECQNYTSLTSADRKINYNTSVTCDNYLVPGWFRFQGAAGTRMPTSCPPTWRCNTHATGWLNGGHPTVADGKVTRQVCFHWDSNCCLWSDNIQVRDCGSFYVYYLSPPSAGCSLRYCGTD
ncbi:uncharacterized protein LOC144665240 isoform X2 [Oculina patagonica]